MPPLRDEPRAQPDDPPPRIISSATTNSTIPPAIWKAPIEMPMCLEQEAAGKNKKYEGRKGNEHGTRRPHLALHRPAQVQPVHRQEPLARPSNGLNDQEQGDELAETIPATTCRAPILSHRAKVVPGCFPGRRAGGTRPPEPCYPVSQSIQGGSAMDQKIINLYDNFTHGRMSRREFMDELDQARGLDRRRGWRCCRCCRTTTPRPRSFRRTIRGCKPSKITYDLPKGKINAYLVRAEGHGASARPLS